MDIVERRLRQLDADYEATIAAGTRREPQERYELVTPEVDSESLQLELEFSGPKIDSVTFAPRPESPPLTEDQVSQIKTHMSSFKLCHNPEWAAELSDDQFARVFTNVFSRDNS